MNNDYMFEDEDLKNFSGYSGVEYSFNDRPHPEKKENIGLAIVSLVLGTISLVFFLIGINIIFAIASIVLAAIFLSSFKQSKGKGLAIAGIITSALSIGMFIISWAFIFHNLDNISVLSNDTDGLEQFYYYYGIGDDELYYNDIFDEYPMFERDDTFPFNNGDFDINDTL